MSWQQDVTPNLDPVVYNDGVPLYDWYGWCLATVRAAFNAPYSGGTAWIGWTDYTQFKHEDRNFPVGVYFPVWFSGYGGEGHVAICFVNSNGSMNIWTSPYTHKPYFDNYSSIGALENGYNIVFAGWSEDVAGMRVIEPIPDPAPIQPTPPVVVPPTPPTPPTPPPSPTTITAPVTASSTTQYSLVVSVPSYPSPGNAASRTNSNGKLANGAYYIFNQQQGMYSLTKTLGQSQGTWINPADNVVAPPKPVETGADIQKSFKWFFPTHEPVTYKVLTNLSVQDILHGSTPVPLAKGREVEIYGTFQANGNTYLRPLTGLDDKGMYSFYGIKTTNMDTGAPYLVNEFDIMDIIQSKYESFYDKAVKTIEGIFRIKKGK